MPRLYVISVAGLSGLISGRLTVSRLTLLKFNLRHGPIVEGAVPIFLILHSVIHMPQKIPDVGYQFLACVLDR